MPVEMTVGNRCRLRLALDVGQWMTLAPLQADVLEWVPSVPSNFVQDLRHPALRKPTERARSLLGGAVQCEQSWRRQASPTSQMKTPPRGVLAVAGFPHARPSTSTPGGPCGSSRCWRWWWTRVAAP